MGALYLQEKDGEQEAIGCREAFRLGQAEFRQYRLLEDPVLEDPAYRIYRSLQRPGRFLIAPKTYSLTRFGPNEGEKAFRPAVFLYTTIDAEHPENSRCVVMASLQPDLPPFKRRELIERLHRLHAAPVIEYLTEIEAEVSDTWAVPTDLRVEPTTARLWDSFQVSLATDVDGVPQLRTMLEKGSIAGAATFTLPDGSKITADLKIDLSRIAGPWDGGAVTTELSENQVRLVNRVESTADVSEVRRYGQDGAVRTVPIGRHLAPGEILNVPVSGPASEAVAVYSLARGTANLAEIRSFIEDIHTNVVFVNLVNYANHALKRLDIRARIQGVTGEQSIAIGEGDASSMDIVLPLTRYLEKPVLEFQVIRTDTSDHAGATPWLQWSLSTLGHVVGLTWELITPNEPA
jgi:hypothetical protein